MRNEIERYRDATNGLIVYNLDLAMFCCGMFVLANLCFLTSLHKRCIGKLKKKH